MVEKLAHYIRITFFEKGDEEFHKLLSELERLLPFEVTDFLEKSKVFHHPEKENTTVYVVKKPRYDITTTELDDELSGVKKNITLFFENISHVNEFLENLADELTTAEKEKVLEELDRRMDRKGRLYIRLDKKGLSEEKCTVVDRGDCYKIQCSIATYPRDIEEAKKIVKELFSEN